MSAGLKKRAPRRKSNVFQFMKQTPGPKSNKDLYNHAVQFLTYMNGTPEDAIKMLEDYGLDRKKAIGMVNGIVKGRMGSKTDTKLQYAHRGARAQSNLMKDTRMAAKPRRTAKMDLMTGFTGKKVPDPDLGLDGNGYFEKWTTVGLPDTGKNIAIDDEQQPTGGGAPETVAGIPLKVPMEAEDVTRPKLREGREARRKKAGILRKVALEIRRLDPITARRLMAAADEISYDALSTASLPEAGDETNDVDDYQDQFGHGTLQFFGTDPAKSTSLTRESSRRRRKAAEDFTRCEISFKYPGDNWDKVVCKSKDEYDKKMKEFKEDGAEVKVRHFDNGEVDTNLEFASRGASRRYATEDLVAELKDFVRDCLREGDARSVIRDKALAKYPKVSKGWLLPVLDQIIPERSISRGGSRRRSAAEGKGVKDIDWTNTLKLVDSALQGKYDRGAVAHILKSDYDRTMGMLKTGQGGQNGEMVPGQQGQHATASRKNRRARTEGDPELKPEPTVGDQDGPGADGAGGFEDRSKAPLQETMTAQDVDRPKIRENPEAGRLASLWGAFRSELIRQASGSGKWNSGRYAIEARDYGDSVEVQASVVDRENLPMPVGSILFSKISDSPRGRYATVEINDGILENRTTEFTIQRPRQAAVIVRRLVAGVVQSSKDLIDGITV